MISPHQLLLSNARVRASTLAHGLFLRKILREVPPSLKHAEREKLEQQGKNYAFFASGKILLEAYAARANTLEGKS
jgi:hypothetical protein